MEGDLVYNVEGDRDFPVEAAIVKPQEIERTFSDQVGNMEVVLDDIVDVDVASEGPSKVKVLLTSRVFSSVDRVIFLTQRHFLDRVNPSDFLGCCEYDINNFFPLVMNAWRLCLNLKEEQPIILALVGMPK